MKGRTSHSLIALGVAAVAACSFATTAPAKEKHDVAPSKLELSARCAGDTVSGTVKTSAPAGTPVVVALSQQPTRRAAFVPTGQQASFVTRDGVRSYAFAFNVSKYGAWAYRVESGNESRTVQASSCAPGKQVPEAPMALLLPLSVLAALGIPALRRRRHAA